MSRDAVSRSYATALFEASRDAGALDRLRDELGALESAWDSDLQPFLLSPKAPMAARLSVLDEVFADASDLLRSFLRHVVRKGRAGHLPAMIEELRELDRKASGRAVARLDTATEVDGQVQEQIRDHMADLMELKLDLEARQDPAILGGFVVRVGDRMLDASLKTRLEALRKQLKAS